jgi:predicted nucleotidyltransferase component of viral defense system
MNEDALRRLAGRYRVPVGTLEKDYAITLALSTISRFSKVSDMVFKGGTSIKKIYFPDTRFSEDLDFTCYSDVSGKLLEMLKKEVKNLDMEFTDVVREESLAKNSRRLTVKYNDFNGHANSIKIDISLREEIMRKVENREVLHMYDLGGKFRVPSMHIEEVLAEKIRAMIFSAQPRHLYDVWFLLQKNVKVVPSLVQSKTDLYDEKFNTDKMKERVRQIENHWLIDLQHLLPATPPFEALSTSVVTRVSRIMK